ncbi:MAG: S8 family serine peptidase, partial [Gammaproteobacteria bacterium]|nr:S8 family serine peptidase [Gammaproteobacteria bacterium]
MMILLAESSAPLRYKTAISGTNTAQKDFRPILQNIKTIPEHLLDEKAERQTLLVARLSGVPEPTNGPMAVLSEMEEVQMPYLDQFDMSSIKVPTTWNTDWLLEIIRQDSSVDYAYKQPKAEFFGVIPNDEDFENQTNLHDTINDVDVDAPEAWAYTTGSENVVVAVLDGGLYINNLDLRPNLWVNEAELTGRPDMDDDNNGCIDDIHGCDLDISSGKNLARTNPDHGTLVASVLASRGNDGYGIAGVAWNVRIMLLKGTTIDVYQYILKMKRQHRVNIRVLNFSGGFPNSCDPLFPNAHAYMTESQKLGELMDEGVLFVQAIGNGNINYNSTSRESMQLDPGCHNLDNIIVVAGQSETTRTRWMESSNYGSSYGNKIGDLYAPAFARVWRHFSAENALIRGGSSTSRATPHVSAAAALLWSFKPDLTVTEVRSALLDTVDRYDTFKEVNEEGIVTNTVATGGALNIANALYSVATPG